MFHIKEAKCAFVLVVMAFYWISGLFELTFTYFLNRN